MTQRHPSPELSKLRSSPAWTALRKAQLVRQRRQESAAPTGDLVQIPLAGMVMLPPFHLRDTGLLTEFNEPLSCAGRTDVARAMSPVGASSTRAASIAVAACRTPRRRASRPARRTS